MPIKRACGDWNSAEHINDPGNLITMRVDRNRIWHSFDGRGIRADDGTTSAFYANRGGNDPRTGICLANQLGRPASFVLARDKALKREDGDVSMSANDTRYFPVLPRDDISAFKARHPTTACLWQSTAPKNDWKGKWNP